MEPNEPTTKKKILEKSKIINLSNRIQVEIAGIYQNVKQFVRPYHRRIIYFVAVSLILLVAWLLFLYLVFAPPIGTTPALIMVWASVAVLLVGVFPGIFDRVKRIKIKDFELELQETVDKASSRGFVSISELNRPFFSDKDDFVNLTRIISSALRFPDKPVLLVVNLKDDKYISIIMLQIYLFFLDLIAESVFVLFISAKRKIKSISDIEKASIIGAVSGEKVKHTFFQRFPELYRIFDSRISDQEVTVEQIVRTKVFLDPELTNFFQNIYNIFYESEHHIPEYLTKRDVEDWFWGQLSNHTIELSISVADLKTIRKALMKENEFIMIYENGSMVSLIPLCFLAKNISGKAIADEVHNTGNSN